MEMSVLRGLFYSLLLFFFYAFADGSPYLKLSSSGSLVRGATINFSALLYDHYPDRLGADADYIYHWSDNADPPHEWKERTRNIYSNWSIEYSVNTTKPGPYRVICDVQRLFVFWFHVATNFVDFVVTEDISGSIVLTQNGQSVPKQWVSTTSPVNHTLALRDNDKFYLHSKATDIKIFWFKNCLYLGMSNSLSYEALYADEGSLVDIEAVLVASFDKLPEPIPSSTISANITAKTSITTTAPQLEAITTATTNITLKNTTSNYKFQEKKNRRKRNVNESAVVGVNQTVQANAYILGISLTSLNTSTSVVSKVKEPIFPHKRLIQDNDPPYDCKNKKYIAQDPKKAYGYYKRRIVAINPINNFTVTGKNWLQHGELVNLDISCRGTVPVEYCLLLFDAPYNVTGNETCSDFYKKKTCAIKFKRYFSASKTVLFFLRNPVSTTVNQVTINIYEAKKASQLSVVVVPVSFTLIAVICVIFGLAFYVQSRNRFMVEVADFNFGETQPVDMEYKTFSQRLFDSICDIMPTPRRLFSLSSSSGNGDDTVNVNSSTHSNSQYNSMT